MFKLRSFVVFGLVAAGGQAAWGQVDQSAPVGSIIAWHKSFSNTPPLSSDWVECNGQVLNNPSSPYDGQAIPDLNGEGRFLRGSSSSGTDQEATEVAVVTETNTGSLFYNNSGTSMSEHNQDFDTVTTSITTSRGIIDRDLADANGPGQISSGRVRAKNMSVVWIMRIMESPTGNVPAVGGWALAVMVLALVVGGTLVLRQRRVVV